MAGSFDDGNLPADFTQPVTTEVGGFVAPTSDFVVDVGGGDPPVRITVRLGGSGTTRVY